MKLLSLFIQRAHAQSTLIQKIQPPEPCSFSDGGFSKPAGSGFYCIANYIGFLTQVIIGFAASIALIMLIINGIRYMIGPATPGGSSDAAKKGMVSSIAGLLVCLLTYVIIDTFISAVTQ